MLVQYIYVYSQYIYVGVLADFEVENGERLPPRLVALCWNTSTYVCVHARGYPLWIP